MSREVVLQSDISVRSLKALLKNLKTTSYRIISESSEAAVKDALATGEAVASATVAGYPHSDLTGAPPAVETTGAIPTSSGYEGEIILKGENAVFFEFGAGQYYNSPVGSSRHPDGVERGAAIGTYSAKSGKGHASEDWWYLPRPVQAETGLETTHGVESVMPLYKAKQAIIEKGNGR